MTALKITCSLAIAALMTSASSCIKKDDVQQISQVLLVPLSPDAAAVDFVINDQIQATTVNYSSTVGTATYGFPYYTITPGVTTVRYNLTGTTTAYASTSTTIEPESAYSTFLIDSVSKSKMAIVKDDLSEPSPGKVKLRFFHFSPNAPAIDVAKVGGATLFTNRKFDDQGVEALQKFIEVDPGPYVFSFRNTGTTTEVYKTSTVNLLPDRIYTVAARGFVGGTTNRALGALIYANRP